MLREWLSGRASPCQGERREFESRLPLQLRRYSQAVRSRSAKPLFPGSNPGGASNAIKSSLNADISVGRLFFLYSFFDIYKPVNVNTIFKDSYRVLNQWIIFHIIIF